MSVDLKVLENENKQLKQQLQQNSVGVEGLLSQLDAHRQMINEFQQAYLMTKTNLVALQKQNEALNNQIKVLEEQLNALKPKEVNSK